MRRGIIFLFCLAALAPGPRASAGDEDVREEKPVVEKAAPADTALPAETEAPGLSVDQEPEPTAPELPVAKPAKPRPGRRADDDADTNIDYSGLLRRVQVLEAPRGVLAPALGFRGYRPNMIALGVGDRTPGYGAMVEYSWNRIGAGVFASYLNHHGGDKLAASSGFAGAYALYRWLPFDFSPYFLAGLEGGSETDEAWGGLLGLGIEARIYEGWTVLLGWTHHSTVRRGYLGGALGWSF